MNARTTTITMSWTSNVTKAPSDGVIVSWRMAMITLITVPLSAITIIGNILVIISFRVNPLLRTVSNYFLLSLAVADLILGTISMNLYTTYILMGHWTLGNLACDIWLAVDYVASNASVMNLLAISFDRYLSVTRPLTYRVRRTPKRAALMIALAWGISFVLWAPAILFWQHIVGERTVAEDQCSIQFLSEPVITFGTAIAAFYFPVSVMVVLYWQVYRETEKRSKQLAGLMGSHVGGSNKSSQSQSSSSYVSDVEKLGVQTSTQPKSENSVKRSLCPFITHCTATLWKTRRIRYIRPSSNTADYNPQAGTHYILSSQQDAAKKPADVPLALVSRKLDSLSNSDVQSSVRVENCQSDSQQSISECPEAKSTSTPLQDEVQRSRKPRSWSLVREKKAARTLCAILLAFIMTWTPYNIMVLVSTFCDDCVPESLWQLGYWLCYVNSTVNPLCYAFCNKQFRVTFKALLLCRWSKQKMGRIRGKGKSFSMY
ncbi:muscarinic acetylcholine receptor M3 [Trichomycterus rosablanca]|uniref:muscarinic acetylcholine receptor M3 n=1 Tax=Trichomycterus rosablanca TaxID=2290929 RepID=UPI002F35B5C4